MGPGPEIAVSDGTVLQATSKLHHHISKYRTDNLDVIHDTARKRQQSYACLSLIKTIYSTFVCL
jgi:hypothetical protein